MKKFLKIFAQLLFTLFLFNANISIASNLYDDEITASTNLKTIEAKFNKIFENYGKNENLNRYTFYINPKKWSKMSLVKKVQLYEDCTRYHMKKEYITGNHVLKVISQRQIRIRSSIDGTLLAEYNPNNGVLIKRTNSEEIKTLAKNIEFIKNYNKQNPKNKFEAEKAYRKLVYNKIKDNTYSYKNMSLNRNYEITLDKYGSIKNITILYSDYIPCVDDYAINLIRTISPFPTFFKQMDENEIAIHVNILVDIDDVNEFIKQLEFLNSPTAITYR